MLVTYRAESPRECSTVVRRADGVVLSLPPAGRKWRVPHDMAHAATEIALRMRDGVFGTIAAGGLFDGMRVLEGRTRHDAAARSERLLKANAASLTDAELLAWVIHDSVERHEDQPPWEAIRRVWASRHPEPPPWTQQQVAEAQELLRDLDRRWHSHARDGVELVFPDDLAADVPPAPRHDRRHVPRSRR